MCLGTMPRLLYCYQVRKEDFFLVHVSNSFLGEFIVEVHTRMGKIYDKVEVRTNLGRRYDMGGNGGEEYTVHKGAQKKNHF